MKVHGILAPPRVSRNNNLYLPEELAKADGLTVPMYLDHEDFEVKGGRPTGTILRKEARGRLKLIWNTVLQRLEYAGQVWDEALQKLIVSGQRPHVSLAAEPRNFEKYRGHNVPLDMTFFSVAAVQNPGIPESTVNYTMEQVLDRYLQRNIGKVMESVSHFANTMVLEFDTKSLTYEEMSAAEAEKISRDIAESSMMAAKILQHMTGEHDFDAAIDKLKGSGNDQAVAALKSADEIADRAKEKEAVLSTDKRNDLPASKFAAPASSSSDDDKLPVPDREHAVNAKARFNQTHFDSPADKEKAKARVNAALAKYGLDPIGEQNPTSAQLEEPITEPLHPDFQKMKSAMSQQYGADKGKSVFYATVNKHNLDDTKPMPKEFAEAMGPMFNNRSLIPQGYQNLTPMRANQNQRSGLPGVTGVSQGVPMAGTSVNPVKGIPDPVIRPIVTPTAQDQQILPRNRGVQSSQPMTTIDNPMATGTGVTKESSANKSHGRNIKSKLSVNEDGSRQDVSQANQSAWGAETDKNMTDDEPQPHAVDVKNIGLGETPYESLLANKVMSGKATAEELKLYNVLVKEGRIDINGRANPETQATAGVDKAGNGVQNTNRTGGATVNEADDGEDDGVDGKKMADDLKEAKLYGYSSEEFYDLKSTRTKEEWPLFWQHTKEALKGNKRVQELVRRGRLEASGVISRAPTGSRESKIGGPDVRSSVSSQFGVEMDIPNLEQHVAYMRGERGPVAPMHVPLFFPPDVDVSTGLGPRLEFVHELTSWTRKRTKMVSEAIATTTSGAAMAVDGGIPALIVPTNLSAMLRDTVYFQQIQQGSNIARFQTVTVPAAGALTQNTEPSQASQTLTDVDITPTPRGVEQQVSFEAERKILGPILEAVILSFRVSELYDEDYLLLGSGQSFEAAPYPTTGGPYSTGNAIYGGNGTGRASEALIQTGDTMAMAGLADAQDAITLQGFAPNNMVEVMQPQQFRKLMQDSNVNRVISFGPNTNSSQSWIAQGVIPELVGFEIRRSTLGITGSGVASITTYHSWAYIKGLTPAMAASRDLMIETFRDIRVNSTWVKGHWDLKGGVLQPNSLVLLDTA